MLASPSTSDPSSTDLEDAALRACFGSLALISGPGLLFIDGLSIDFWASHGLHF